MATCEFSDVDEAFCDHCRRKGKPAPRPVTARITGPIEARYPGVCRGCFKPYSAGAQIVPGDTGWIAECCSDGDA